jgi:hypothetical protein
MSVSDNRCSDDEWRAYWRIGQIREIASPGFAYRVNLARELGLLAPLLAGDSDKVATVASECIESLSAQIHWVYQQPSPEPSRSGESKHRQNRRLRYLPVWTLRHEFRSLGRVATAG